MGDVYWIMALLRARATDRAVAAEKKLAQMEQRVIEADRRLAESQSKLHRTVRSLETYVEAFKKVSTLLSEEKQLPWDMGELDVILEEKLSPASTPPAPQTPTKP